MRRLLSLLTVFAVVAGCSPQEGDAVDVDDERPSWVEEVYPEPGATAAVPDAVEVHHALTDPTHNVRLIIDDVDVTTYSTFDAEKMRYESGAGPVVLAAGDHTAEVQLVTLPIEGTEHEVLDTYRWRFRTS